MNILVVNKVVVCLLKIHQCELINNNLSDVVVHPMTCDACQREGFSGFRYRCQKCHSYQLCQDCFWRGRVSGPHTNEHEVKEYTTYVSFWCDLSFACDVKCEDLYF